MVAKIIKSCVKLRFVIVTTLALSFSLSSNAISFKLDSIAEWGKFPRFCVNVYRWGDKFFNTYDSTYVRGTGTKFNIKLTADSWLNHYRFILPNDRLQNDNRYIDMHSRPSTSMGLYLTYLAVSIGYDINLSSIINGVREGRQRYQLAFNCALFGAEVYKEINNVQTRITRFGSMHHLKLPFNGMHSNSWGIDAYYFFNNKRYSQAAAFNFGKIQTRSQGSFYAGLSIYSQNYNFDFSNLEEELKCNIPEEWEENHFISKTRNYGIRAGYAYNWVFARRWLMGVSVSPTIGIKHGYTNSSIRTTSFSMFNHARLSVVWNAGRWFAGIVGNANTAIISSSKSLFLGNELSFEASVGYRFNIW